MAGYHLCSVQTAERPFFLANIQVAIRSVEELAYFFSRYPALVDETIMDGELVQWVAVELNLPRTAARMKKAVEEESARNFAGAVLRETGLLAPRELAMLLAYYEELDAMKPVFRKKAVADALLSSGKISAAIEAYRYVVDALQGSSLRSPELLAAAWHDRGVAEMRLMLYEEAMASFKKAMHASEKEQYRTDYLAALLIARPFDRREGEIEEEHISPEELLMAEELVADARTEDDGDKVAEPVETYLAGLTAAYHAATGL